MNHGIPEDIRWLIEAKVRLSGESSNSFISYMPGTGKSTFAKKRRAKRLKVYHRCARWTCSHIFLCVPFWCDFCFASFSHPSQMMDNGTP